jgi:hypothetical protein
MAGVRFRPIADLEGTPKQQEQQTVNNLREKIELEQLHEKLQKAGIPSILDGMDIDDNFLKKLHQK